MSLGGEINPCGRKNTAFCRGLFKTHLWGNFCGVQSLTFDLGNDLSSCSQDVRWVEGLVFANDDLQYADQVGQTLLHHLLKMLQVLCKGSGGHTQAESWDCDNADKKNNFILKVAIANSDLLESQQIAAVWHANQLVTWTLVNHCGTRSVLSASGASRWKDKHSWVWVTVTQLSQPDETSLFLKAKSDTVYRKKVRNSSHLLTTAEAGRVLRTEMNSGFAFMSKINNKTSFPETSRL